MTMRDAALVPVHELLGLGTEPRPRYIIPSYQRPFAWDASEVGQLLTDVREARARYAAQSSGASGADGEPGETDYFLGTLVVAHPPKESEGSPRGALSVVDGQQRLTTICLLLALWQREHPEDGLVPDRWKAHDVLGLGHRRDDHELLASLGEPDGPAPDLLHDSGALGEAVEVLSAAVAPGAGGRPRRDDAPRLERIDVEFLLDHVVMLRHVLPERTSTNHFFEVMNTRGEQIRPADVLKARLMDALPPHTHETVDRIWSACADLEHPLPQDLPTSLPDAPTSSEADGGSGRDGGRSLLEWLEEAEVSSVESAATVPTPEDDAHEESTGGKRTRGRKGKDEPAELPGSSIVTFEELLLHALARDRRRRFTWDPQATEPLSQGGSWLDARHLLELFSELADEKQVRCFIELLPRVRLAFDAAVIRSGGTNPLDDARWSLAGASDENDVADRARLIMLESMYQVTDTDRQSKYFIHIILNEVLDDWESTTHEDWIGGSRDLHSQLTGELMQRLSGRLEQESRARIRDLVLAREDAVQPHPLDRGLSTSHLVLNVLDYLLWRDEAVPQDVRTRYRFVYRSTIEHFYPQHPDGGERELAPEDLNSFGNLCLMSRRDNSSRSNFMPEAKATAFKHAPNPSLKLRLMMRGADGWAAESIRRHRTEMVARLRAFVDETGAGRESTSEGASSHPDLNVLSQCQSGDGTPQRSEEATFRQPC